MKREQIIIYFPYGEESLVVGREYEHGVLIKIVVDYDLGYPAIFLKFSADSDQKIITHEKSIVGIPFVFNKPKV